MKRYLVLVSLLVLASTLIFSQTIQMQFPREANKSFAFVLNHGIKQDTVARGTLNFAGTATISIPKSHKGYVGMGVLKIKEGVSVNMVINNENFAVSQGESPGFIFKNSRENSYLYRSQQNTSFQKDTSLYADKFLQIFGFMQDLQKANHKQLNLAQTVNIKNYALHQLDIDALYTSGLWYYVIDGVVKMTPLQEETGNNMVQILKRVKSNQIYESLVDNLITITEQFGWDDAFHIIISNVQQSGRIETPQGNIFTAFALTKVMKGNLAPKLIGLKSTSKQYDKILLFFYDPGCHNCEDEKQSLINKFDELSSKKIRIISISSESDDKKYKGDIMRQPWEDKLCDLKGFAGPNFINFGIMSTPTFFLLDKDWKVIGRYAIVKQIPF